MTKSSEFEDLVRKQFIVGEKFIWEGDVYEVLVSGKPTPSVGSGEPKTDCFIILKKNNDKSLQYKISCKLKGKAEFQENKIKAERAEQIFGLDWQKIIQGKAEEIREKFISQGKNYPDGHGRVKRGHLILGWKLEIESKYSPRSLSRPLDLDEQEIRDKIYKGINLDEGKRNSKVNGLIYEGSGVANYMLVSQAEEIKSPCDVLDRIIDIDDYEIIPHHIIFTSNSYRVNPPSTDSNRPLAVRVVWSAPESIGGEISPLDLIPKIEFDHPLAGNSNSNSMRHYVDLIFEKFPEIKSKYKEKDV